VTLHLPKIVAVEGRVVDAKGTPVANAAVTAMREEFGLRMMEQCVTSADGRFSIPDFAADAPEMELSVTPARVSPRRRSRPAPASDDGTTPA